MPASSRLSLDFRICLENQPTRLNRDNRGPANIAFSVPSSNTKYRNINLFPIDYAFRPHLAGSTHPARLTLDRNPGLPAAGFCALSLLMSAFALLIPPACLTAHLHRLTERSPTQQRISVAAAARCMVRPVTSSAGQLAWRAALSLNDGCF